LAPIYVLCLGSAITFPHVVNWLVGVKFYSFDRSIEPTIGLDPSAKKVVWEKLTSFKREYGVTVFFNTHYMDEADLYSDEIGNNQQGTNSYAGHSGRAEAFLGWRSSAV